MTKDPFNNATPFFDKSNQWKVGTPFGGGVLIILVTTVLTFWAFGIFGVTTKGWELFVLFFSFIGFGMLGFYDDVKKLVKDNKNTAFFGLRFRYKFMIQWILAFVIAFVLYAFLGNNFVYIPGLGALTLGWLYIPFAAFVIVSFANAANITDGLDGLATGLMIICLIAFLAIAVTQLNQGLGIFIGILRGSLMAFLYFNIYQARIWMGDVGSLSLGAALAVIGLLTGKTIAIAVIGGIFVLEVGSSMIQMFGKRFLGRRLLPIAPLHLYFLKKGWEEPKIVMRFWLAGTLFAILGLYLAFIS